MSKTIEALRLADQLESEWGDDCELEAAAAELRRLHAENTNQQDWLVEWRKCEVETRRLHALNQRLAESNVELLKALVDISYGLEGARIWGGMVWTYNPLHPFKYLPLRDKARAAIARAESTYKAEGEMK